MKLFSFGLFLTEFQLNRSCSFSYFDDRQTSSFYFLQVQRKSGVINKNLRWVLYGFIRSKISWTWINGFEKICLKYVYVVSVRTQGQLQIYWTFLVDMFTKPVFSATVHARKALLNYQKNNPVVEFLKKQTLLVLPLLR